MIRGIERCRGRPIAYSLGNFVGYHTLGGDGLLAESGVLRVTLSDQGALLAARWFSVHLYDSLPYPERSDAAARLVANLPRQTSRHGASTCRGRALPAVARPASQDQRLRRTRGQSQD